MASKFPETESAFDIFDVAARLWHKKLVVIITMIIFTLAGVLYLNLTVPAYTAELRVTAASSSQAGLSSRLGSLGGLAAMAGVSVGTPSKAEPFDLYIQALKSREVANVIARDRRIMHALFEREWDPQLGRWTKPKSLVGSISAAIKSGLGLSPSVWISPNGARLQDLLIRRLRISTNMKDPVTVVQFNFRDPDLAVYLLGRLNAAADAKVRYSSLKRAREYLRYLNQKLPTVTLIEQRTALTDALSEQEKTIMLASSNVQYSAMELETPTASLYPTSPKVLIVLALAMLLGLIFGGMFALMNFRRFAVVLRQSRSE